MKKIIAILISILTTLSCLPVFAVSNTAEAASVILSKLNVMSGDPSGNLRLDDMVSRAEFTKIAVASSNYRNSVATNLKTSSYKDVPAFHWAAPYIKVGVEKGLCKGYTDATFRPDNTVTYEESITMLLKILGYTDGDFGSSWPYGQLGLAENLEMTKDVDSGIGEPLSRRQVAVLVYNTLNTKMKDSAENLVSIFDVKRIENVVLITTNREDGSVSSNKVYTSEGAFKFYDSFDYNNIGKRGDLFIKNDDELLSFAPYVQNIERHIVYSLLDNSIVTYYNNAMTTLTIPDNTPLYQDMVKSTYSTQKAIIEMGDILYIKRKSTGEIEYVTYEKGNVVGPVTVTAQTDLTQYSNAKVLRNGSSVDITAINQYDIIYYIADLNMLLAYSNRVTGIYEKAEPNKDAPTGVIVSGISYKIEGSAAFGKLFSNGNFNFGDAVTLLLGKTNQIADVIGANTVNSAVYGYLYETGTKEYTKSDLSTYTGQYIKVALTDGQTNEYIADRDYKNSKNSVVKIIFENGVAKASTVLADADVYGKFDWTSKRIGNANLSSNVKILDISTLDSNKSGTYASIFPNRMDGINLSSSNILLADKNEKNEIISLILNDVTGDTYSYGIVTKADGKSSTMSMSGSYTYDIGGVLKSFNTSNVLYSISSGQAAKFTFTDSGSVQSMQAISRIESSITEVTNSSLTSSNSKYPISNKVVVYYKDYNYNYTILPLSEIISNKEYNLTAYYDKSASLGGMVRIIVATKK